MTQKHLAKKVKDQWDLNLILGNLEFLGLNNRSPITVPEYVSQYLSFVEKRKSDKAYRTARGILVRFQKYLATQDVKRIDEITVKVLDGYIDSLNCSPKTKKNHLTEISLMLKQAVKEELIPSNPAKQATLPRITKTVKHRPLEPIDMEIIFKGAGSWSLYYAFLYHTGLRAGDVALLKYGNIDRKKRAIVSFVRKSRRIHEFPIADSLLNQLPTGKAKDEPLFPELYAETERKLNDNLTDPREFMQALLESKGRPKATLHSFRVTFNNTLRDLGLSIEDRQILLAHASSETTKIYTHPNHELARQYVNKLPTYGEANPN
jgi:integrase